MHLYAFVGIARRWAPRNFLNNDARGRDPVIGSSVMRIGYRATVASLAAIMSAASINPVRAVTPDEVKAFVAKAMTHIKDVGQAQAFADFSQPDGNFVAGELYIFCQAPDGVILAHGANPALVGRNFSNVIDPDGVPANREINRVGFTYGEGWVHFKWPNPVTKKVQPKSAWIVKVNDEAVCGAGYYHD